MMSVVSNEMIWQKEECVCVCVLLEGKMLTVNLTEEYTIFLFYSFNFFLGLKIFKIKNIY